MRRWVFASAHPIEERPSPLAVLSSAVPAVVLASVVTADMLTPPDFYRYLVPLLVAVPALAAITRRMPGTLVFILLSLVAHVWLAIYSGRTFTPNFYGGLLALTTISVVSVLLRYLHFRHEERVRRLAETMQNAVLAPVPEHVEGVCVAAAYRAADEESRIGGDLYEVLDTPYGVRMIVGDAKGKGINAVEAAANLLGAFREAAHHTPDLCTLAKQLEGSVRRHNSRRLDDPHDDFITAVLVSVPAGPVAEVVCCGHPAPLLLRNGEIVDIRPSRPALPLGLGDLGDRGHPVDEVPFDVGDRLLLYTDGVTEARDAGGTFYPLAERAAAWTDSPPDSLLRTLARDLIDYTRGNFHDDVALLACEREAAVYDTGDPLAAPAWSAAYTTTRDNARAARLMVTRTLAAWGMHGAIETTRILVDELVTNAITHARGPIRVTLRGYGRSSVLGEVTDTGGDTRAVRAPDPGDGGGYGLRLVDTLAHQWGCRPDPRGKTIWFVV